MTQVEWKVERWWTGEDAEDCEVVLRPDGLMVILVVQSAWQAADGRLEAQLLSQCLPLREGLAIQHCGRGPEQVIGSWALRPRNLELAVEEAKRRSVRAVRAAMVQEVMES